VARYSLSLADYEDEISGSWLKGGMPLGVETLIAAR
jgi:hypothetical protein